MHTKTGFPPVPARRAPPANQQGNKQCVGIFNSTGALYGRYTEVSLVDLFLELRVPMSKEGGLCGRVCGSRASTGRAHWQFGYTAQPCLLLHLRLFTP